VERRREMMKQRASSNAMDERRENYKGERKDDSMRVDRERN